ncbi:MAG TPA: hypothetical protein VHX87_05095 [Galbitalea sp.]|nr:hypothetical protein [Galbitalea sp.]
MKVPSRLAVLALGMFAWLLCLVVAAALIPWRWDPTGTVQVVVAVIAVAGLLSLHRPWRPLVSFGLGVVVVGAAWVTAFLGDFSTPANASNSTVTMFGTLALAVVYVMVFRVLGNDQVKSARIASARAQRQLDLAEFEAVIRRVVTEELEARRS